MPECDACGPVAFECKEINMRDGSTESLCSYCLEQITCPNCDAVEGTKEWGTVGDGFDGYCPSCADARGEMAGHYDD